MYLEIFCPTHNDEGIRVRGIINKIVYHGHVLEKFKNQSLSLTDDLNELQIKAPHLMTAVGVVTDCEKRKSQSFL